VADGDHDDGDRYRQVDEEDKPPGHRADQPPAEKRPDRGGHAAKTRPGANRLRAVLGGERRLQDRQAPGGQQRGPGPLHRPGPDEEPGIRRQPAGEGGEGEPHRADDEDPAPAVHVAKGTAEQQQAGQRERVTVDDPLHAGDGGVEVPADRGQRDADHRRVEGRDARSEHGRREHPPAGPAGVSQARRRARHHRPS
jgi:hypothetical protein